MKNQLQIIKPCYGTTYIRHINGLYLNMNNGLLCLSSERFLWRIESFENNRFYLKEITGHDNAEYWYGNFQTALDSGYTEQHWLLHHKDNYIVLEHADSKLFVHFSTDENLVLKDGTLDDEGYFFYFEAPSLTDGYPYKEIISNTGKIALRFESTILNIVNTNWLKDWIDDLEKAVYSLTRLTGFLPFPRIEIRTYTNCNSWGYIYYGKPVVHINNKDFEKEIIRMRLLKKRDISFGALHEISHLFDKDHWLFEGETTANMKIPFVLKELDFSVSLSSHDKNETYTYDNYAIELYKEHGRLDNVTGLFSSSLAAKLTEIAQSIGWDAFSKTFINFPSIAHESRMFRFETFINKLSEYAQVDVRNMFTYEEWNAIARNLSN